MAKHIRHKPNRLHMAVLAGIASLNAHAIGMGEIAVHSRLNQPLRAEVPIIELSASDADLARVVIRTADDAAVGSTNSSVVSKLSGRFVADKHGYTLQIRSQDNIREPIVSFYVEVILPNAHARREFTVLLDPPEIATAVNTAPPPPADPYDFAALESSIDALSAPRGSKRSQRAISEPPATASSDTAPRPAAVKRAPARKTGSLNGNVYGPVMANENLWSIARTVRPNRDVSMYDMMQQLLAANPEAFINNDMNLLREGASLRVPGLQSPAAPATPVVDAAATTTPAPANSVAPMTTTAEAQVTTGSAAVDASPTAATSAVPPAQNPDAGSIAAGAKPDAQTTTTGGANGAATASQNAASPLTLEPAAAATRNVETAQSAETNARLDELAARLESMQKMLVERESQISTLEQTLDELNTRLQNAEKSQTAATAAAAPIRSAPLHPQAVVTPAATPAAAAAEVVAAPPLATASRTQTAAGDIDTKAITVATGEDGSDPQATVAPTAPATGVMWGVGATLAAALGGVILWRRRRPGEVESYIEASVPGRAPGSLQQAQDDIEAKRIAELSERLQSTVVLEEAFPQAKPLDLELAPAEPVVTVNIKEALATTPVDHALGWENDETVPNWSMEQTIEVALESTADTLAQPQVEEAAQNKVVQLKFDSSRVEPLLKEVDLQMAYLQFEDAERLLMTPLQDSPNEASLLVKLAEVHVAAGNIDKFVDLAVRLSKIPEVRASDDWKKIAKMGEMIAPTHPLFEYAATVELTRDEFGNLASRA